jgi:hypothetical protein
MSKKQFSWLRLSLNVWQVSLEAQQVISLRLALLAGGSESTRAEAARMVSEKMSAALEVQACGSSCRYDRQRRADSSANLAIYHRKIPANRRRLSAAKPPATGLARRAIKGAPK